MISARESITDSCAFFNGLSQFFEVAFFTFFSPTSFEKEVGKKTLNYELPRNLICRKVSLLTFFSPASFEKEVGKKT